jgi:hypothetical protein
MLKRILLICGLALGLRAQEWPSFEDRVDFTHNGSLHAFWVPTDAPEGEPLRVIVSMRGAGGGLQYPSDLMAALTERSWHAVVVQNSNSYSEIIATELVQELRDDHGLTIEDEIFLIGNSRGGQGVNRLMQQIPAGIGAAVSSNPGNLTTPSGRLFGQFPSNQGGWTDEEIGPVGSGPPWTAQDDPRKMALGDPALPGFEQIPVMIHAGANDQDRYPHSLFFAMEMQERGHPHFETLFNSSGHGMNAETQEAAVDFFLRVHENDGNTPPMVSIDGPRIITLSPGTTHTLTAAATDAEDADDTLQIEWRKVSLPNEPQFVTNDTFSYMRRYQDGVEGWIPLHRYAEIQVDGFNNTRDGRTPRVLSTTDSLTFTVPTVTENTFVVIEVRAIDSSGFVGTDSVMVFINAPPLILEGPEDKWTVHQNATTPMRFRALDVDSAGLTWTAETAPANGTVTLTQSTGEFVELEFTPNEDYLGADSLVLRVTDALGLSSDLTVNLTVANDALSFPAEMNAVRQRSTDAAGSLTSGSSMTVKTGSFPGWMDNRSAYFRFPLEAITGEYVSAQVRLFIAMRFQSGTETLTVYKVPENENDGLAFAWGVAPNLSTYEQIGTVTVDAAGLIHFDVTDEVAAAMNAEARSLTLMFYADSGAGPIYASRHWPETSERPALEVVALTGAPELPSFPAQPEDASVTDGEPASFTVEVFGIPFPEIQWQKNGVDLEASERIQGVNELTLTIDPVEPGDAGGYRAVATNTAGATESDPATLTVNLIPPTIIAGPDDIASVIGRTETFAVVAEGSEPLSYVWEFAGSPIPGAEGPELEIAEVEGSDAGEYTVTVSNDAGSVSASATLTVNLDGTWTLSYDANGGSGSVPAGGAYNDGTMVSIDFSPSPTREDVVFGGWKRHPYGAFAEFVPGGVETLVLEENTTLYAHWMAPWTLIENFEGLNPGNLSGQNGWTGSSSTQVIVDPEDEENQVMRFAPSSNHNAVKPFAPVIANEGVSTLFFCLYIPDGTGRINQQLRLPTQQNIRLKVDTVFGSSEADSLLQLFDEENENQEVNFIVERENWYLMWLVLDYEEGQAEWWIRAESETEPVRILMVNVDNPEEVFFAGQTIPELVFVGWNNGPVLYDDLYVFHGDKRLDDPRAAAGGSSPLQQWLEENGLESPEDEVNHEGATYRAEDLFIMGATRVEEEWQGILRIETVGALETEGMSFGFQAQAGRTYTLERTPDLITPNWEPVGVPITVSEAGSQFLPIDLPESSQSFYRIKVALD